MRLVCFFVLYALVNVDVASACPVNSECLKYRRFNNLPHDPTVMMYQRSARGFPTRLDRRSLTSFLTAATWTPMTITPAENPAATMQFITTPRRNRTPFRLVLVRQIERRQRSTFVDIDGAFYVLERCNAHACLKRVGGLPDVDAELATPP